MADAEAIMQTARLNSNEDEDIEETKIITSRVQQKKTSKSEEQIIVTTEKLKVTKLKPLEYLKMKEKRAELASKNKTAKKGSRFKKGGSILCCGAFVTGPSYDKMISMIVMLTVSMGTSSVFYIFVREL